MDLASAEACCSCHAGGWFAVSVASGVMIFSLVFFVGNSIKRQYAADHKVSLWPKQLMCQVTNCQQLARAGVPSCKCTCEQLTAAGKLGCNYSSCAKPQGCFCSCLSRQKMFIAWQAASDAQCDHMGTVMQAPGMSTAAQGLHPGVTFFPTCCAGLAQRRRVHQRCPW